MYIMYTSSEILVNESNTRSFTWMTVVMVMVRSARFSGQKERKYAVSDGTTTAMCLLVHSFPEFWVKFSYARKVAARSRRVDNVLP